MRRGVMCAARRYVHSVKFAVADNAQDALKKLAAGIHYSANHTSLASVGHTAPWHVGCCATGRAERCSISMATVWCGLRCGAV